MFFFRRGIMDRLGVLYASKNLKELEAALGINFNDKGLLVEALTHSSLEESFCNEGLEFVGDGVLGMVVKEYLFKKYYEPEKEKHSRNRNCLGYPSELHTSLVNNKILTKAGKELNLENFILFGKKAMTDGNEAMDHIVGNAVEALIGAIYLDQGLDSVRKFIDKNFFVRLPELIATTLYLNPITVLQNKIWKTTNIIPTYKVFNQSEGHEKIFKAVICLGETEISAGYGRTKKEAKVKAAENALELLNGDFNNRSQ